MDLRTFNVLSLCTGAGGLDLGLKLAVPTSRVVCCVEHEAYGCEVLAARMEEEALAAAPIWSDLRTFDGLPWRGAVDCVIGGFPCQPFSVAGRKLGEDDPRHLWPHIARVLREVEPTFAFFENVSNILNLGYRDVRRDMEEMGFRVTEGLFTAEEVGAPHRRERLFILAYHDGRGRREWTDPTESRSNRRTEARKPSSCGGELDNSYRWRRQRHIGWRAGTFASDGREELGDAEGGGLTRRIKGGGLCLQPGGTGRSVGNAHREGLQGRECFPEDAEQELPTAVGTGRIPVFPPGASDQQAWQSVSEVCPTLEPALRRVDDGVADRVGRLRLCGNGVVPLAAAHAFRTLAVGLLSEYA